MGQQQPWLYNAMAMVALTFDKNAHLSGVALCGRGESPLLELFHDIIRDLLGDPREYGLKVVLRGSFQGNKDIRWGTLKSCKGAWR